MRPAVLSMALAATSAGWLVSAPPCPAAAWADANVEQVAAHVEVDAEGQALVGLVLTVRIHGGWLEGLDLEGLDPDITLIEGKPPSAVSVVDPEQKWRLTVRPRDDGGLRLTFPRRASPRRGRIRITLAYTTNLGGRGVQPIEDERVRISWTLPGWRSGLERVEVALTTPVDAVASPTMSEGPDAADGFTTHESATTTSHIFRRLHLPRTLPWTVAVNVPAEVMAPALRGPTTVRPEDVSVPDEGDPEAPAIPFILLALPLLAALGSRLSFDASARRRGLVPRPLVPGPGWLTVPAVAGLAALADHTFLGQPAVALGLLLAGASLCLQRTPGRLPHGAGLGSAQSALLGDARRACRRARLVGSPLLDLTTVGGAALLLAMTAAVVILGRTDDGLPPEIVGVLSLMLLPFALATRMHLPPTAEAKLLRLADLASKLADIGPAALRLTSGPTDARLSVALPAPPPGLLRFEVVVADSPTLGGFESAPALLLVTEAQSEAESVLAARLPGAPTLAADGRATRLIPVEDGGQTQLRGVVEMLNVGPVSGSVGEESADAFAAAA